MIFQIPKLLPDGLFPVTCPTFGNLSAAGCRLRGCQHVDAHVRTLVVVKVHCFPHCLTYLVYAVETHAAEQLVLYRAVDTLGTGIVFRVAVMLMRMPCERSFLIYSVQAYWQPLSE